MKNKIVFLMIALSVVISLPMFGQDNMNNNSKSGMKMNETSGMMGNPAYETTSNGLHFTVWIMTQEEHKKMMNEKMGEMSMQNDKESTMDDKDMKDKDMGMDKTTMDAMMSGTHHIKLSVTDVATGKAVTGETVKLMIVAPSKKSNTIELMNKMDHYGSGLDLNEKGGYQFTLTISREGTPVTNQFMYMVK